MFTFATKQSSIVKLWGEGFIFYKNAFLKIWYILLIMLLISALLQYAVMSVPIDNFQHGVNRDVIFAGLTTTVSLMVQFYCIGLILHRMYNIGLGANLRISESMRFVRTKYLSLCATAFAMFILVLLGIALLIIPGIFLGYALMFSVPAIICQNTTAFKAIMTSLKLVWGHWWRTVGVIFPVSCIQMIYFGSVLWAARQDSWILNVFNMLLFAFVSSLLYAFILVQFNDLKLRKKF